LKEVPKDALVLGMAGVIPYLATSLETVYLSYEVNRAATLGDGLIFSGQSAELMLHMLEPIQIGYGAVVSGRSMMWRLLYPLCPSHPSR
jgi:hypothetical protein